ncbi:MAG: hypothetical protein NC221_04320 [Duncaniella sp.]|nr:hypothetical protein [Duncaniella sp.]
MRLFPVITTAVLSTLLSGCFTGVESTPKITGAEVKKECVTISPEDNYLTGVTDSPLSEWERGKRFVVTDDKIKLIFGATAPAESLTGKEITFTVATESTGITGGNVTDLSFTTPTGAVVEYRINQPLKELSNKPSLSVPFTIQQSMVEQARELLNGKRLYILTRSWRDDNDNSVGGRQFVPVTIDSVSPGNSIYPIKVSFTDEHRMQGRMFITPGDKKSSPRTFSTVFSFDNPRKKYPDISPENWDLIIRGRVGIGMTREECRLALGSPKEIDRAANNSYLREVWLYENGIYLVFEDGLLKFYRR